MEEIKNIDKEIKKNVITYKISYNPKNYSEIEIILKSHGNEIISKMCIDLFHKRNKLVEEFKKKYKFIQGDCIEKKFLVNLNSSLQFSKT